MPDQTSFRHFAHAIRSCVTYVHTSMNTRHQISRSSICTFSASPHISILFPVGDSEHVASSRYYPAGPQSANTVAPSYMIKMAWLYGMIDEEEAFYYDLPAEEQEEFALYLIGRKAMILTSGGDTNVDNWDEGSANTEWDDWSPLLPLAVLVSYWGNDDYVAQKEDCVDEGRRRNDPRLEADEDKKRRSVTTSAV
ncbi:hypothetical protein CC86DRAFT_105032 [Ophiobolus disseminans]|uniref:Uncharacterized protein n=1 Tax=Ophiobolus disseminans TaxID=1469910 RepID=A0A6A6ZML7_9PLEO|nr:hypothetical protein CC86DRAFT_105032 [Ophiobolus disseminans]